jgi:peptidoglycan-associated lipoprotein
MELRKWLQAMVIGGSIMALAACSTSRKHTDQSDIDGANSAYGDGSAQAQGAGDDAQFGDQASARQGSDRVYYFDFDSNVVRSGDKPAINKNADYLMSHARGKVMLEGNTDPRGSREYNIGLGERRAQAVAEIMTGRGVNPKQIRIVSYGAEKLASNGRSESDYQQDRRVVLVYMQR